MRTQLPDRAHPAVLTGGMGWVTGVSMT